MSVKVLLPNAFQKHTNGEKQINSEAANLPALVTDIETHFPALKQHLRDGDGKLRQFINFYVNDEDIRFLGNDKYAFKDGDEVLVIPSIAGGCSPHGQTRSEFTSRCSASPSQRFTTDNCSCCSYCGQEECSCS